MSGAIVIRGQAYSRPVQLQVRGSTLTWRAHRGIEPENIATTVHDVRDVTWLEKRWSVGAGIIVALSVLWISQGILGFSIMALVSALALSVWRWTHPRYWLGLDLGTRWLVMRVEPACAGDARELAERIHVARLTGDAPLTPPTLP